MRARLALMDPAFSFALPQYDPFRPGDIRFSCASIEKVQQMLSYSPTHTVAQGLDEALDWYVERARTTVGRTVAVMPRHLPGPTIISPHHAGTPLTLATS